MIRIHWTTLTIAFYAGYVIRGLVTGCGAWASLGGC